MYCPVSMDVLFDKVKNIILNINKNAKNKIYHR